ncbi:Rha family transcriptional regulator [Methylobacterium fujisawaense]|uniref:Rha family transcriptional regulator n=1 Tax=Methylobacterium fujisawaense TaxID=107400 RepID=UPI00244B2A6F|nr:Rha family transcriptional regulator [Methylobacterium fujisawaense]MDH3032106.1 Rha family transcriptional regulator [Methylobacterium fujisawaense]
MSSLEIAELTGKNHADVLQDIRAMLEAIDGDVLSFRVIYRHSTNRTRVCFHLPFDEAMTLVAGYDAAVCFKIVRRWRELAQAKQALPNFTNPAAAAPTWADKGHPLRNKNVSRHRQTRGASVSPIPLFPI